MVKLNKIYTRTGDDGTTGLVDGSRLPKHAARMEAIGAVDEANSALGLAVVAMAGSEHAKVLTRIQNDLFDLGADLATPRSGLVVLAFGPAGCCQGHARSHEPSAAKYPSPASGQHTNKNGGG